MEERKNKSFDEKMEKKIGDGIGEKSWDGFWRYQVIK